MSSKSSHMKRLNYLPCMLSDYKNISFKSSLIFSAKFYDACDDEIDEITESNYNIFEYTENSYKRKNVTHLQI